MPSGNILTILDAGDTEPGDEEAAYRQLCRLANRHGCHEDHCKWPEPHCERCQDADPSRHNEDVRYLHQWLQMTGLEAYEAQPPTGFTPSGAPNIAYRRP